MEQRFTLSSDTALIVLNIHGNARVKGNGGLEVIAESKHADAELVLEPSADGVVVRCSEDCSVLVPQNARLQAVVHGNAAFKALQGELKLETIHGNLDLRGVGPTHIEVLHGNLEAKDILGDLQITKVEGNANIRDVQGAFNAQQIEGNLQLDDVDGSAYVQVDGNASLRLDPVAKAVYQIRADGNLMCRLSADASVRVHITEAAHLVLNLPGSEGKKHKAPFQLTLGEGDAEMTLAAGGNILLASQVPAWEAMPEAGFEFEGEFTEMADALSQQVTQQLQAQMDLLEQQLNTHLGDLSATMGISGVSAEHAERIRQQAQEASKRAVERAQEKMRRAQERMERKMETIQQRAAQRAAQQAAVERRVDEMRARRKSYRFDFEGPQPPRPPAPPIPPQPEAPAVTDEERLVILKMLEQKQISLEQAEKLLAALEGNGS
jgi:sRNA-binding protein